MFATVQAIVGGAAADVQKQGKHPDGLAETAGPHGAPQGLARLVGGEVNSLLRRIFCSAWLTVVPRMRAKPNSRHSSVIARAWASSALLMGSGKCVLPQVAVAESEAGERV